MTLNIFPYPRRTKWLLRAARLSQSIGLPQFFRSAGLQGRYAAHLHFPQTLDSLPQSLDKIPVLAAAGGIAPASKVGLFTGCVGESILGETNRATHRVLLRNKSSVACPADQVCCGAIHYHAGYMTQAATFAKANIDAFDLPAQALEAIVVNVAGCGLMLKSYGELLHGDPQYAHRAKHFASKVKDVCEFLMESPLERPTCSIPARVTYHDACHLCHGQQVRNQPRDLLRLIPGLDLVELKESQWCCGAAGTYSLTQPEMAGQLAERKFKNIDETGSQIVAAGNAGCIIHLRQHAVFTAREQVVVHPIDLLDRAYGSALNLDKFAGDPDINKMRRYDTL